MNALKTLIGDISEEKRLYLENSEMIQGWNYSVLRQNSQAYLNYTESYLTSCHKAALVLNRENTIRQYAILKAKNKPVYFGKDVITNTFVGFSYLGQPPMGTMSKFRYIFQTGIQEWWRTFLDWEAAIKTE